jgi:hypothetical protein
MTLSSSNSWKFISQSKSQGFAKATILERASIIHRPANSTKKFGIGLERTIPFDVIQRVTREVLSGDEELLWAINI